MGRIKSKFCNTHMTGCGRSGGENFKAMRWLGSVKFRAIMTGNTFGTLFAVTSFGESHGPAIGCIIDGCPPRLALEESDLQRDLDRRRPGQTRHTSQRREPDQVKILSGVFEGKTTGTPIALVIENQDARSKDYSDLRELFRPGHADYTYHRKYGIRDYRGGGRASARETATRVAAGAVARKWLHERCGVTIRGCVRQVGPVRAETTDWEAVEANPFFFPEPGKLAELEQFMDDLRKGGDSIGARVEVEATGLPVGWGEPVFGRLDAMVAQAMMSINAVKAVEIGDGFAVVEQRGSEHRDEITPEGFLSNHAGGTLGGLSSGQDLRVALAFKPTSSIRVPGRTINQRGEAVEVVTKGRHDPCVGLRAVPIAEAMLALTLMDQAMRHRAQCGDGESGAD